MYSKHLAIAKITDPLAVQQKCAEPKYSTTYVNGLIFCHIPELGFEGFDYIPCRYGLSIPYLRIQEDWKLWVEPTIKPSERWIYTGIADCGGSIVPDTNMQMLLQFLEQVIYAKSDNTLYLSSQTAEEPFVNGNQLKTWADVVDASIKKLLDWAGTGLAGTGTTTDTGGIAPLVATPADYSEFPEEALSIKIFGE